MKLTHYSDAALVTVGVIVGTLALYGLVLALGPWLMFWSLNTILGLTIPFTLKTWFAGIVLLGLFASSKK